MDRGWRVYRWFNDVGVLKPRRERLQDNERFHEIYRDIKAEADSMRAVAERRGCVR